MLSKISFSSKKKGFTFLELIISLGILLFLGSLVYGKWKYRIETNAAESDKLKIVMSINNANIDTLNENVTRKIGFNTDSQSYKKGIYIYRSPVNGVGGGFEQDSGSHYTDTIFTQQPSPNVTFECDKKNSLIKSCPVFIFDSTPETGITYPTNNTLPLSTVTASKGKIYKFQSGGTKTSISFVSYTFDASNYPRNRIFFNSYYSILQIYVYKYIGAKNASTPTRTTIATYHQSRMSQYAPDKDPDWEREKYYVIPLKLEL